MTAREIIECDVQHCDNETRETGPLPEEWGEFRFPDAQETLHVCPEDADIARAIITGGNANLPNGMAFTWESMTNPPYENVTVWPDVSHSIWVGEDTEGVFISVNDHLTIRIDGRHKEEPTFTVESDECPTRVAVVDTEDSFTGVDVTGVDPEDRTPGQPQKP